MFAHLFIVLWPTILNIYFWICAQGSLLAASYNCINGLGLNRTCGGKTVALTPVLSFYSTNISFNWIFNEVVKITQLQELNK